MSTTKPTLILIGGFLGSGKTTLMMAVGERLAADGAKVAVVTNDQGEFLVDTAYARSRGLVSGEVLGGCFCCNFGELTSILASLSESEHPDFILAEPVGSCTDLAATVIGPMRLYHDSLAKLGPYLVLADGARMAGEYRDLNLESPVSPREVLVSHQLKEASKIILSKDDLLTDGERSEAVKRITALVPDAEILPVSVPEEKGLEGLMEWILDPSPAKLPEPVEIDYAVYAAAEAELGWYNGLCTLSADEAFSPSDLAMDMILELKGVLGKDAAHAKLFITTEAGGLKTSLAGGRVQADSGLAADALVRQAGLTLNIRALRPPEEIEELARRVIGSSTASFNLKETGYQSRAFIPGEPKPTHRLV